MAEVDNNGKVTVLSYGTAVITAAAEDDPEGTIRASCTVRTLFRDVTGSGVSGDPDYQYFYKPVYWAADEGITRGYSSGEYSGKFGVGLNCSRGELAVFLWRYCGSPTGYGDARKMFGDVSYAASSSFNKAIAWAYTKGITKGYAEQGKTNFHPNDPITRKDVMIMLYRVAGKPSVSGSLKFTDCQTYKKTSDTYKAILWGAKNGITNGYANGEFGVGRNCLREQIVTFLYRYSRL